jgi:ribosomal protein S18 acetylase RimI-like enzyme
MLECSDGGLARMPFRVSAVQEVTGGLVAAVGRLVPQLSSTARPPSFGEVYHFVNSPATTLFVAYQGEPASGTDPASTIVGMLTLVVFSIPTGVRAIIEDVVVDEQARGQGVGEALTLAAVELAGRLGVKTVDLTSRPARQAANRLYQRLGFELRDSNVYRRKLAQT